MSDRVQVIVFNKHRVNAGLDNAQEVRIIFENEKFTLTFDSENEGIILRCDGGRLIIEPGASNQIYITSTFPSKCFE